MSISGIQSGNYENYYSSRKKEKSTNEDMFSQSRGIDKVSISAEARSKINDEGDGGERSKEASGEKAPSTKVSMLQMLMESLLMAQLAENDENAPAPDKGADGEQSKQNNTQENTAAQSTGEGKASSVAQDGAKVMELKNVINDVMLKGADMGDVISAMGSSSSSTASTGSVASTGGSASSTKKSSNSTN